MQFPHKRLLPVFNRGAISLSGMQIFERGFRTMLHVSTKSSFQTHKAIATHQSSAAHIIICRDIPSTPMAEHGLQCLQHSHGYPLYIMGKLDPLLCGWSLPNYAHKIVGGDLLRVIVGWTHCSGGESAPFALRWQSCVFR